MHEPADPFLEVVPVDHQPAGAAGLRTQSAIAALLLNHRFELFRSEFRRGFCSVARPFFRLVAWRVLLVFKEKLKSLSCAKSITYFVAVLTILPVGGGEASRRTGRLA
jgi:hypothetical protein